MRGDIRSEWDETKQHDVLFLLTICPPYQAELALMQQDGAEPHPAEKFGLAYVRGCEVMEVKDEGTVWSIILCAAVTACISMDYLPCMEYAGFVLLQLHAEALQELLACTGCIHDQGLKNCFAVHTEPSSGILGYL